MRTVSLDVFTIAALVWQNGQRPHPDTETDRVNQLVDSAGVRRVQLHDVRHTYSTLSLDSGINPKILSDRVGHSNPTITFQIYAHRSAEWDRAAAQLIGQLIEDAVHRGGHRTRGT